MSTPAIRGMIGSGKVQKRRTSAAAKRELTLFLFVLCVGADHAHDAFATDDLAVLTDTTNGCSDFHGRNPLNRLGAGELSFIAGILGSLKGGEGIFCWGTKVKGQVG